MDPLTIDDARETVRDRIRAAALERFRGFGYGKTTMAEIAGDCGMTAGNLYRYFDNKRDIAADLAATCLAERETELSAIIAGAGQDPAAALESFLLALLEHTHRQWSTMPRFSELVDSICESCPELVNAHRAALAGQLARLVEQGNAGGRFSVDDPAAAAEAILAAATLFTVPHFMSLRSLDEHQRLARRLAALMVDGLATR
jgi:AcrR family transcriptional regulator